MSAEAKYDGEPNVSEAKGEENGREFKDDDEGREFLIIPESLPTSLAETRKGFAIDLDAVGRSGGAKGELSEADEVMQRATTAVRCLFDLPDGSQLEGEFQMGHTVEVLKSFVALECGIPIHLQHMFLEDSNVGPLIDPMSLGDYPQINPKEEVLIRVEGEMGDSGAKK